MNCPLKRGDHEVLLDYCAQKLGRLESRQLEAHFATCPDCARFEAAQRTVWSSLDEWEEPVVSADFNRRLYAAIEREKATGNALVKWLRGLESRWTPVNWRPLFPMAAACVTLVAAVVIGIPNQPAQAPSESQVRIEKIDIDQVEQALDDVDLLKNLGSAPSATSSL